MDRKLIILQHFFEVDNRIKKEMYDLMPPTDDSYLDENSICKYSDKLSDSMQYIFSELKCCAIDLFGENSLILRKIKEMEISIKHVYYNCGLDINKLRKFYKICITDMDKNFINEVKINCIGYGMFKTPPVNMANSINEILHLIHYSVLNNEEILHSIHEIGKKENNYNYPITYRGLRVETFENIFMNFPLNLDVGWTDMIALSEKKLLMMVRDRGHALTIEITLSNNIAKIEYFIPKICNVNMVNNLPGVNKVTDDSIGTTGIFEVEVNKLSETLYDLISKVPTDLDMINNNFNTSKTL